MLCRGIIFAPSGETFPGGDRMAETEVVLGGVSYQLSRVFIGSRTANELLLDHVVDRAQAEPAVDVTKIPAV